jgi:hypothetical protein
MPVALGAALGLQELLEPGRIDEGYISEIDDDRRRPAVLDLSEFLPPDVSERPSSACASIRRFESSSCVGKHLPANVASTGLAVTLCSLSLASSSL